MTIAVNDKLCKKLILFILGYTLCMPFCISILGFPSFFNYFADLIYVFLLIDMFVRKKQLVYDSFCKNIICVIILFSLFCIISTIINLVPIHLFLWGGRNLFRGIIFLFLCITYLEKEDIDRCFSGLLGMQIINFGLSIIEFSLGYRQDFNGGIFGINQGCNGYLNAFMLISTTYFIVEYNYNKIKLYQLVVMLLSSMIIAGLTELRIFYIELVLICLLTSLMGKKNYKVVLFIIISVIALLIGLYILSVYFPKMYEITVNLFESSNYAMSQGGGYNLSRAGAFIEINEIFFNGDTIYNLFGLGVGAVEYSAIDYFTSDFYKAYGSYNYRWFSHMMLYLQTGILGYVAHSLIFITIFIDAFRIPTSFSDDKHYIVLVKVLSLLMLPNVWYNQMVTSDGAYMCFFPLAICYIIRKNISRKINKLVL